MIDIVPTKVQWEAFASPRLAVGYFHWPLLANVEVATRMIDAYGGDRWCKDAHVRIQGNNVQGQKRIAADNALEVYAALFKKRETIMATCEDYASGAAPEVNEQAEDMKNGRKLGIPTMVIFSTVGLGAGVDVANIWRDWVDQGVEYKPVGVGNGHGHYLPEEASDIVTSALKEWVYRPS